MSTAEHLQSIHYSACTCMYCTSRFIQDFCSEVLSDSKQPEFPPELCFSPCMLPNTSVILYMLCPPKTMYNIVCVYVCVWVLLFGLGLCLFVFILCLPVVYCPVHV